MKVLIADDEIIIREGMANVIPWNDLGFTLLKPVSSAEEVMKQVKIECPDILITDIQMKGMTGLELISYLAKNNYQIESILLTGYDDFEYIQEAIRQNVCDYLLKTSSPSEIISAVERAKNRLEKTKEYDQLKESEVERHVDYHLWEALENESNDFNHLSLLEAVPILRDPPYQLLLIDSATKPSNIQDQEELWNSYFNGKWFSYHNHTLVIVRRDAYVKDDYLLQIALRRIKEIYHKPIFLSEIVSSLAELPYLYKQVVSLISYQWIMPNHLLIDKHEVGIRKGISHKELAARHENDMINCMKEGNEEKLKIWISDFIEWLFSHPHATPESIQFYVENLYIKSIGYIDLLGDNKGLRNYSSIPSAAKWFENPKERLFRLFLVILNNFKSYYHKSTNYVEESIIYMERHLGDSISLQKVAKQIPIHPNYLSDMIRKKTGKSYVELLTDLRIKKAADYLLYTSVNIKEIAGIVGYSDSKYFTKIFKKHFSMTPTQYRDKHVVS